MKDLSELRRDDRIVSPSSSAGDGESGKVCVLSLLFYRGYIIDSQRNGPEIRVKLLIETSSCRGRLFEAR